MLLGNHRCLPGIYIKGGIVDPKRMLTKGGFKAGDNLILTKALGTGIINNALKGGMLDAETEMEVAQSMATLNKRASESALEASVHACTDVTGFGLAVHLLEMIRESKDIGIEVDFSSLPLFPRVEELAFRSNQNWGIVKGTTKDIR